MFDKTEYKNILLIKPSALGDIVMALPALAAIKDAMPGARVSWLVRKEFAPLLRGHRLIDELVIFDRKGLGAWYRNRESAGAAREFVKKLRGAKYDLAIDLQGLFRSGLFGFLSGAKTRVGMAGAREFATVFYNRKVRQDEGTIHLVDYFLKIAEEVTGGKAKARFELPVNEEAKAAAGRLMESMGLLRGRFAVLVPGSARANKCWPTGNFAATADYIATKYRMKVAAIGVGSEAKLTAAIKGAAKTEVADLAGKTNIPELVEVLRSAGLVLSNDTGPGHIAGAAGTRTVLIFGPTNPARVCVYGKPELVAAVDPKTRGFEADSYRPEHAIERITLDMVFEKIDLAMVESRQEGKSGKQEH